MTNKAHKKIAIAGWGLAGATLAWQLHFRKLPFVIYDSGNNHATRTAAGLVNPIVFKRLTKSWNVDLLLPYAETFYQKISEQLNVPLLSNKKIYYPFSNTEDENNWSAKMGDERFTPYIEHTQRPPFEHVTIPHGMGQVNTFGNLDTNAFLDHSRSFFEHAGVTFVTGNVGSEQCIADPETNYIFCEGIAAIKNPLFRYLPLKTSHGETLVIESPDLTFTDVVSKNLFILPLGNHRFKVGATYNWQLQEPVTTEPGKADLQERLGNLIDCPYTVVSHQAGIRPTVADRRPLLGVHPVQPNAFIFNGLGTKGVMLAPYYSNQFADFMLELGPLDEEVNIKRFHRRFLKS